MNTGNLKSITLVVFELYNDNSDWILDILTYSTTQWMTNY